MEIIYKNPNELLNYSKNQKKHPQSQIDKLKESIKQFGFTQPVVIDNKLEIIIGHGRTEAAKQSGLEKVPCVVRSDLTASQVKALRIADNKLNESKWIKEFIIEDLKDIGSDIDLNFLDFDLTLPEDNEKEFYNEVDSLNLKKENVRIIGKWDMPRIKKSKLQINEVIPFSDYSKKQYNKVIHFFLDDYRFERVWNNPDKYVQILKKYKGVLSPNFSTFLDYPKPINIFNTYRSRWCGAYWQSKGIEVIPSISWSGEDTLDYAFEGIDKGCSVTIPYFKKCDQGLFIKGYKEMIEKIQPETIYIYGKPNMKLEGNIKLLDTFNKKWEV